MRAHQFGAFLLALWLPANVFGADASLDLELIAAAKKADIEAVRALLKQGANVNARYGDGTTPLHWAAYRGNRETAHRSWSPHAPATRRE